MRDKPVALAACRAFILPSLERMVGSHLSLLHAASLADARQVLHNGNGSRIELLLCTVHFDNDRMQELLRYAAARFPHIPIVCCRIAEHEPSHMTPEGFSLSVAKDGAAGYIDWPGLRIELGADQADAQFRSAVLRHLRRV